MIIFFSFSLSAKNQPTKKTEKTKNKNKSCKTECLCQKKSLKLKSTVSFLGGGIHQQYLKSDYIV